MKECEEDAVAALVLNVPAMNCPIAEHEPIRIVLGLTLCAKHLDEAAPGDFLTADGRLEKIIRLQARGRAEPDFARAFCSRCEFDSAEWKILSKPRTP